MPTAEEFEAAAVELDAAAATAKTLIEPARAAMAGNVMVGGQLTVLVTDELDVAAKLLEQVTAELAELAATCRERAEASRVAALAQQAYAASYADYESDLNRWQEAEDAHRDDPGARNPGPPPAPPDEPPPLPSFGSR
ncbi:hypothetical protein [Paractinoplanes hotanensis]|uniref:YbaB/EbfC DNA-binding family protein n=1 Tax=Paractinoplanes hotanensis TaxID=2906497 RepID=A0ABT0Y4X8_9ACTN|nr:hypothetical protein [Actinoplanes hotanensis]MCM4081098.1 hypothetical protein [Actinoplanes hotanensis]